MTNTDFNNKSLPLESQNILADISIARANLYVFREENDKMVWENLLNQAEQALYATPNPNYDYARKLLTRVEKVVSSLWQRIFKWKEMQQKLTLYFIFFLIIELLGIILYYENVALIQYGFYTAIIFGLLGGTISVILSIGEDLKVSETQAFKVLKLILRPLVGIVSAIIIFLLLKLKLISIMPNIDEASTLILLSFFAGFSERFIIKAMNNYLPRMFQDQNSETK